MLEDSWIVPPAARPIYGSDRFVGVDTTVSDFWRFVMSDLRTNNIRGYLAEFLVAKALGLHEVRRVEWDACDLQLDGIKVEVKSAAYLQAWEQRQLSRISFSRLSGTRYDPRRGYDENGPQLNAHVYVFCVQTAQRHEEYDPLDVNQWAFYVVRRSALERHGGKDIRSIGLNAVKQLAGGETAWLDLNEAVLAARVGEDFDENPRWPKTPKPAGQRSATPLSPGSHNPVAVAPAGKGSAQDPSEPGSGRRTKTLWVRELLVLEVGARYPGALPAVEAYFDTARRRGLVVESREGIDPLCRIDVRDPEEGVVGQVWINGYKNTIKMHFDFTRSKQLTGRARSRVESLLLKIGEIVEFGDTVRHVLSTSFGDRPGVNFADLSPEDVTSALNLAADYNATSAK